jgi:hypothetical protein
MIVWIFVRQPFTIRTYVVTTSYRKERLVPVSSTKKKRPALPHAKQKEQVNKRALIWVGVAFAVIVIVVGTLLALNI